MYAVGTVREVKITVMIVKHHPTAEVGHFWLKRF